MFDEDFGKIGGGGRCSRSSSRRDSMRRSLKGLFPFNYNLVKHLDHTVVWYGGVTEKEMKWNLAVSLRAVALALDNMRKQT